MGREVFLERCEDVLGHFWRDRHTAWALLSDVQLLGPAGAPEERVPSVQEALPLGQDSGGTLQAGGILDMLVTSLSYLRPLQSDFERTSEVEPGARERVGKSDFSVSGPGEGLGGILASWWIQRCPP